MVRAILIVLVLVVAGGYVAWPYYTLQRFDSALAQGDEAVLARLVDWPAVRAGLEVEVAALRGEEAAAGAPAEPEGGALTALIAPNIRDLRIDAYASPQGLARLLRERKMRLKLTLPPPRAPVEAMAVAPKTSPVDDPEFELAASEAMEFAKAKMAEARVVALLTYDALRTEYAYLFFTGPTTFRAEFTSSSPQQIKPLVLVFTLSLSDYRWRLTRVLLPRDADDV